MSLPKGTEWASKELLEFVAHMKNGDTSVLSQFDVQALLLEYIKRNNLRDPRRKSQIICDSRLGKMFGKARVGHFEMLKLLESHFLIKEDSHADYIIQGGFVDSVASQVEVNGNNDNQLMMGKDKRRKARKKGDTKGPQTNLDEYAAIDVHNINLIYLRRNSMENLIEDTEKFHEKVVGSVVRIRITSNDQKQDMYRLVQVVGTSKVDVPYKIGKRTADVMLEILNLDKKEVISIDGISNQEFSEDECRRLRQSVKCGLVKRFTVGEIQEKAVALRAMKVNDWLETEMLRLSHLRDRASEKGHRKEYPLECVEKLQLLNTPEERQRRIQEIPEVHDDPNMDPTYESEEDAGESDDKKKDDYVGAKGSGFIKKGGGPISPRRGADISKDNESSAMKSLSTPSERKRNTFTTFHPDKEEGTTRVHEGENGSSGFQGRVADGSNSWEKPRNLADASGSAIGAQTDQAVVVSESFSGFPSETSMVPPTGITPYSDNSEIEKMWHYQDPSGTNQGPFSMMQLRKWSATGFFPPNLRIWRINEQQDDSILLTNALNGQHHKEPPFLYNSNDASAHSNDNNEFVRSTSSSCWSTPVDVVNSKEGQAGSFSEGWDSLKGNNSWSDQPKMDNSLSPPTLSGKPCEILSQQEKEAHVGERWCSGQSHGNWNSHTATAFPSSSGQSIEKCSNSPGFSGQPARQSWIPPTLNCSSNSWNLDSGFVSKSSETSEHDHEVDFSNMPSPTPKPSNVDSKDQAAENKQSVSSNVPLQDSGPSWSTASSLVGGGAQLPDVAGEWGGYSPTPDKPSVEEWDSSPVAESSLKPTEVASDLTTSPTSKGDQLPHCSPSHPASNTSSWQEIVNVPNEFPLAEESVSDLLAEVDAMESLGGLPSPTSALNCSGELGQVPKNDCFSTVEGLSPTPDPGKSDALSSTGDVQMPSQSTITDEPHGVSHADVLDSQKRSGGHSSTSAEIDGEGKPSDVSVNQCEAGSDIQPAAPSTSSWDMPAGEGKPSDVSVNQGEAVSDIQPAAPSTSSWDMPAGDATDAALRTGSETTDTGWGPVQGNANLGWGGPAQIHTNLGWGSNQGMLQGNANMNWGISGGNLGMSVSQLKYSGESFHSPRGRGFSGGGSGFGRGRSSWHRQSSFGGGGGGGSSRPPPRGKIICKFYESGYCKKGASCPYLHP
ncbi:hypothetical protein L1049_025226 [Liquidambar formosana]|uniref:Uncharacterized protein n=1 Tax=Liquidambar formosana TaxID=63359 RepID=A0AAP0RVR0_LIQFO